jgi:hypothetical protein
MAGEQSDRASGNAVAPWGIETVGLTSIELNVYILILLCNIFG